MTMKEILDSQEFFDLMQAYRIADATNQDRVVEKFEAVKQFIANSTLCLCGCDYPKIDSILICRNCDGYVESENLMVIKK